MGDRETSMVPFSTASWLGLHLTPSLWVIPELETAALQEGRMAWGELIPGALLLRSISSCWVESCRAYRCSLGTGMGGREVGEPVLGQRALKAGWGGEAGAPEIWRRACVVWRRRAVGMKVIAHCCCWVLKIGNCVFRDLNSRCLLQVGLHRSSSLRQTGEITTRAKNGFSAFSNDSVTQGRRKYTHLLKL